MTVAARRTFRQAIDDMLGSWVWELDNLHMNRIPDPIDYIEMRRRTFGADLTMSLLRLSHLDALPAAVSEARPVRSLENSIVDCMALLNDMFSYRKEIEFEGEVHNAVLVVRNFLGCDQDRAFEVVNDLLTARMNQFEHVVGQELPALEADLQLDTAARTALAEYVQELRDWLSAIKHWHRECHRYGDADLEATVSSAPARAGALTGLGTSAARLLVSR
jgi:germacradienol/geosmin synthase